MIGNFINSLKENKRLILTTSVIFLFSAFIGYLMIDVNNSMIKETLKKLLIIASQIKSQNNVFYTMLVIFLNNLKAALFMIGFGVVFGIFPIFAIVVNGLMIGVFLKMVLQNAGHSILFFIVGIVPHGIFEIPAIIIASAFGMSLGFGLFRVLLDAITKSESQEANQLALKERVIQLPIIIFGVTVLLIIAAIIESTLTPYLLANLNL